MRSRSWLQAQRDSSGACPWRQALQIAQTSFFHISHVFKGKNCRLKALVHPDQVPTTVMYILSVSSSPTLAMLSIFLDPRGPVSHRHFSPARTLSPGPAFPCTHGVTPFWTVPSSSSLSSFN